MSGAAAEIRGPRPTGRPLASGDQAGTADRARTGDLACENPRPKSLLTETDDSRHGWYPLTLCIDWHARVGVRA
jgi:hypothetical protein